MMGSEVPRESLSPKSGSLRRFTIWATENDGNFPLTDFQRSKWSKHVASSWRPSGSGFFYGFLMLTLDTNFMTTWYFIMEIMMFHHDVFISWWFLMITCKKIHWWCSSPGAQHRWLELNWEAYSSREDFHREKHYDFCSKQVPNSEQNSSNMFQFAAYLEFCVTISLRSSEVFELLQVLSVYTTFPRFLFPREDHRGKEQHLKSLCTDNHKSWYFVQRIHI